jgi:Putative peptidoglycan binding domain
MEDHGQDVIDIGSVKIGQRYILGARAPLDNPNWRGPWDCAEFTSWCAYQAYGLIFGAGRVTKPGRADPYSGFWYDDAMKFGHVLTWQEALKIPGAVLIRRPRKGKIGHVAFAMGDGDSTLEARGAAYGVGIFKGAAGRSWTIGCLLPGVDYSGITSLPTGPKPKPAPLPLGFLWLREPNMMGPQIVALQRALDRNGIDPGPFDGEFGPMTDAAVITFQVLRGIEVDGVVGPVTAGALGLGFPVVATPQDEKLYGKASTPPGPATTPVPPVPAPAPPAATFDGVATITRKGNVYTARTAMGVSFILGSATTFTDDMTRVGLFQGASSIKDSLRFGVYAAADHAAAFGQWAHFIEPTLSAEGGARFATLNTYDRAAFNFGAPQMAAHTPGRNFVVYFRQLLALPGAENHFPELSLRKNAAGKTTIHLAAPGGGLTDLEEVVPVTRPNGKRENQLAKLMAYLNGSPTGIDQAELTAAARLMNWLRLDPKAKELQVSVFIDHAKGNLKTAKAKMPGFDGKDWKAALWIMDILHQGRGTYPEMAAALASSTPLARLKAIGAMKYKGRIRTVDKAVARLDGSGVMAGFTV